MALKLRFSHGMYEETMDSLKKRGLSSAPLPPIYLEFRCDGWNFGSYLEARGRSQAPRRPEWKGRNPGPSRLCCPQLSPGRPRVSGSFFRALLFWVFWQQGWGGAHVSSPSRGGAATFPGQRVLTARTMPSLCSVPTEVLTPLAHSVRISLRGRCKCSPYVYFLSVHEPQHGSTTAEPTCILHAPQRLFVTCVWWNADLGERRHPRPC